MGIGNEKEKRKIWERIGIEKDDFDVIELKEEFDYKGIDVMRKIGIEDEEKRVKKNGGEIEIGNKIGM